MNSSVKLARVLLVAAAVATAVVACDLGKTTNQATARAVAVATLLSTPPVDINASTLIQFDASLPDSGIDAGVLVTDAGLTIPAQTLVTLFFGQRQGDNLDVAPVPTTGAQVRITEVGGQSWPVPEVGAGNYALLGEDAGFAYKANATYQFVLTHGGQTYTAEVEKTPALERIAAFHPSTNYIDLAAGTAFTFTRPDPPAGQDRNLGFVTVFPVSDDGQQGSTTYTNLPDTPLKFLKLVVAPMDWKQTTVTVPGTAFPNPSSWYVIVLQSAKLGGPKSDNLFLGSAIIAGTAEVGVVRTRP